LKVALLANAAASLVAPNHPSGDSSPTADDLVTRCLVSAGDLLGTQVLDLIVVGDGRWVSLNDFGLIQ
jgi:DNA repair protein RadC